MNNDEPGISAKTIVYAVIALFSVLIAFYLTNPSITVKSFGSHKQDCTDSSCINTNDGQTIASCRNCIVLRNTTLPFKEGVGEYLDANLALKLEELAKVNSNWRLTEVYPPTVKHLNFCHQNGTCVDLGLYPEKRNSQNLSILCRDALNSGLTVINEYSDKNLLNNDSFCPDSNVFETTTGGHLHIQ